MGYLLWRMQEIMSNVCIKCLHRPTCLHNVSHCVMTMYLAFHQTGLLYAREPVLLSEILDIESDCMCPLYWL